MNHDVAVIADDLTSAADGAAPFLAAGLRASVLLDPTRAQMDGGPEVVAIDTDTRRRPAAVAARVTTAAVRAVRDRRVLYKTIDSTLRGNIRDEVRTALAASGRRAAIIAPAFPAAGRTTVGGVQLLDGVPVHETGFAADPTHPVRSSSLATLLPEAAPWTPGEPTTHRIVFADAACDADLDRIVHGTALEDVLWVGSPGIAAALARAVATAPAPPVTPVRPRVQRVLVVVGSRNRASLAQLDQLLPRTGIADAGGPVDDVLATLGTTFAGTGVAGLTDRTAESTVDEAAARLSRAVVAARRSDLFDAVIVTGGATARAMLDALRIGALDLLAEPEPGVVAAATTGPDRFPILVKAGGFGDPGTFVRLHRLLTSHIGQEQP
ncbi:four-carbon acid sugar kinase family protein [Amycolatopsis granulosa]|uniref:four-carbon acid sugar kinase family protein n=1 Tax=Amycolatopsis granulosa TaxID=185684 RepID=UPI001420DDCA|nr:uncharacterized protein YgbK (DUF1537 family) [Amycolatopsis granulosa]